MKPRSSIIPLRLSSLAGRRAFTLAEIMTAMAVFSLVVMGVIYTHIFGLKMGTLTQSKLNATHGARQTLNRVRDEIRSAKILYVGNMANGTFTHIAANAPHQGNALQIHATVNTNIYVRYYLDLSDQELKRTTSSGGPAEVITRYITNQLVFRAEDFRGNALTNDQNNRIIKLSLEFYQWEFPVARVGAGSYYDYFRLQTKIARRTIE